MTGAASNMQQKVLLAVVLIVIGLLGYGYYTQYVEYLIPCPLCMTQRFFYYLIGIFALFALFLSRRLVAQKVLSVLMLLSAVGGLATAGRQVWLQHLPKDQVPECGPGLQYWLENKPLLQTLALLFKGDGNCAEVDWTFLGFSMAQWSLAFFALFFLTALWLFACRGRIGRPEVA